jgi:hypothetical protein
MPTDTLDRIERLLTRCLEEDRLERRRQRQKKRLNRLSESEKRREEFLNRMKQSYEETRRRDCSDWP